MKAGRREVKVVSESERRGSSPHKVAAPPALPSVLGVGTDLVHVPTFSEQIDRSGTTFLEVFTAKERRYADRRAAHKGTMPAQHLATMWAMKEAVLKAWLSALALKGVPPPLKEDEVVWSQIVITHNVTGAPMVELRSEMRDALERSLGPTLGLSLDPCENLQWHVSTSFDGDYASAVAILATVREAAVREVEAHSKT